MKLKLLSVLLCISGLAAAQTLTVTPTVNNVTCNGANNGSASIAVSGCAGTPTYVWTPNVSSTNSASNLAPGSYTVNVTTPGGGGGVTSLFSDDFSTSANWTFNTSLGTNGNNANTWVINGASPASGTCGTAAGGNTLHITCSGGLCGFFAPNGEAVYNAGGANNVTDRMVSLTNNVNTVGKTNIQVTFFWRCVGEGTNDYATLRYSIDGGTNWTDLSTIYSGNATWTCATVTLPAACENISTLKVGFRWRNNGNNVGSDPPMNIDNFVITGDGGAGGSGCSGSTTFTITQPATPLSVAVGTQTNVACAGGNTGSITVAGAGGTVGSGYQYKIGTGSYQASPTFSNLTAGTYTITILDANNCTSTTTVTITQPNTAVSGTIANQTPATCGSSNGSVTVSGSGGTGTYQYKLDNGNYQAGGLFNNLAAGSYVVTVQDGNGCTSTVNVTIATPNALSVSSSTQTNVACFGGNTGSVTVAGSGGTPTYQYKIGNGALQTSATFNNLLAGTYTITVQDNAGCTSTVSVTITQPAAALAVAASTQTNVACFGGNTGSITLSGSGGTVGSGYQYKLGNGSYQASPTFSGLTAGTYTFTILDGNNCTATTNITITQPVSALSLATSAQTNVACFGGNTGSVTVTGSGGATGYQYKIGNGSYQASGTFNNLTAGAYVITVQDVNNCTTTTTVTITQPASALSGSISAQGNATCGNSNGSVTVVGAGGTSPYQFKLDNGSYQGSGTFNNLAAGTYTVTVKDNNNCTSTVSVTITTPNALSVSTANQTNVACFGANTGSVTLSGTGGTPNYQYKIGNGIYQISPTFSNLAAGTYTVTILDNVGCTSTVSVTITQPGVALAASVASQINANCNGTLGSVTAAANGGTVGSGYQYKLDNGSYQSNPTFSNLAAGTYTITVQDANSCTATTTVTIGTISGVVGSVDNVDDVTCNGLTNGSVTVSATGGSGQYEYSIDNGATFGGSGSFSSLAAGSYSIIIQDLAGCFDTIQFNVTQPAPYVPTTDITGDVSLCDGQQLTISVTSAGSNACSWNLGGTGNSITVTTPGSYTVTCLDANNCTGTSAAINVTTAPLPTAGFAYNQIDNYNVEFGNQSTNGVTYTWIFPGGSQSTDANPTFNFDSEGTYAVTLVAENDCGVDTFVVDVLVQKLSAVNESSLLSSFNIYPNPANGTTMLQMTAVKPVKGKLQIISAIGQNVYSQGVAFTTGYTQTLDVSKLSAGIYIITLTSENATISRKLIIE